jgi:RimJ/RimL family protein N-acetyltransferase
MSEAQQQSGISLRAYRADDAQALARGLGNHAVSRMTGSVPYPYTLQVAEGWIELNRWAVRRGKVFNFAIVDENDALVGGIGLFPSRVAAARGESGGWEIGYWIAQAFWGRGYATQAVALALDFLRDELEAERCDAGVNRDNPASLKVLQRHGFAELDNGRPDSYCLSRNERVPMQDLRLFLKAQQAASTPGGERAGQPQRAVG